MTLKRIRLTILAAFLSALCGLTSAEGQSPLPPIDGAADARQDFSKGVYMLLGGEGLKPGHLKLDNGFSIEIATDACAIGPDPEAYMADYNREMKQRFREVHGVDVDDHLLYAAP